MATLSSSSTLAQVQDAYDDNASYAEDGSVAKARTFVTACRILLRRLPAQSSEQGKSFSLDLERIEREMREAKQYIATQQSDKGGGVLHPDFSNFRG